MFHNMVLATRWRQVVGHQSHLVFSSVTRTRLGNLITAERLGVTPYSDITSFRSGRFTTATALHCSAMNQKDEKLGKSIFVHFDMTFLTTLTGIFEIANLIFQTWILQAKNTVPAGYFKLENWKNQMQIDRGFVLYLCTMMRWKFWSFGWLIHSCHIIRTYIRLQILVW
jgi:hypothetical protein